MTSYPSDASAVVIGSSGGIGAAIRARLSEQFKTVHAFSRKPASDSLPIDVTDEASIEAAAAEIDTPVHFVFVATGVLHSDRLEPEKTLRQLDRDTLLDVFAINTIGPLLVAKHFLPKLPRDQRGVFAALSARVGSIGDNRLGGWYAYRSSKAALNMGLKTLSIEHRRTHKQGIVVGLHPGTVDTRLSKPFQRGVPEEKLFTPDFSAERLLTVVDGLTPEHSGRVFAWDGEEVLP
jgi:NAD(P)-dependent dehydrogenase (short-subunit alcohol dehydrogenase family)